MESRLPQISKTPLNILADLSNAVVLVVLILLLILNSSNPFFRLLGTYSSQPTTIGITLTFMFRSVFIYLEMSQC